MSCCNDSFNGSWQQFIYESAMDELELIHEKLPRFIKRKSYVRYLTNKILMIDSNLKEWLKFKKLNLVDKSGKLYNDSLQQLRIYGIVFEDGVMVSIQNPLVFIETFECKIESENVEPISLVFTDENMEDFWYTTDTSKEV